MSISRANFQLRTSARSRDFTKSTPNILLAGRAAGFELSCHSALEFRSPGVIRNVPHYGPHHASCNFRFIYIYFSQTEKFGYVASGSTGLAGPTGTAGFFFSGEVGKLSDKLAAQPGSRCHICQMLVGYT